MELLCKSQVSQKPCLFNYTRMKKALSWIYFFLMISMQSYAVKALEFTPAAFRVDFNQEFISITGKTRSSKGSIEYLFPGHIRIKEYKDNSELVSNGKSSWYYIPPFIKSEKGTVQINQAGAMILGNLFDSLRAGLKDTEYFLVKKNKKEVILSFTTKGKSEWKVDQAVLVFKATKSEELFMLDLQTIKLTYIDKKVVSLSFFNFMSDVKYPKDYFIFQIPKNTQVVK